MSRLGVKIGLVAAVVLVTLIATINSAIAIDVYINSSTVTTTKITTGDWVHLSYSKSIDYGNTLKVTVTLGGYVDHITLDVYRVGDDKFITTQTNVKHGQVVEFSGLKPLKYYFYVKAFKADGSFLFDGNTNKTDMIVEVTIAKPMIEYDVKNPAYRVAIGDKIYFKVKIWGVRENTTPYWYFEAYKGDVNKNFTRKGLTWGEIKKKVPKYYEGRIYIDTFNLTKTVNLDPGNYTICIKAEGTSDVAKEKFTISIEKPKVESLTVTSETIPGGSISVEGTTNIAKTNDSFDTRGSNYVYIFLVNSTEFSEDDLKVSNTGTFSIGTYTIGTVEDLSNENISKSYYMVMYRAVVSEGGKFSKSIDLPSNASTGTWTVFVMTMTITNKSNLTTVTNDFIKDKLVGKAHATFDVKKPSIEFTMAKTTFAKGEKFRVTGKTNLPEGKTIFIVLKDDDAKLIKDYRKILKSVTGKEETYYYTNITVMANGVFRSDKFTVNPEATVGASYTIYAVWTGDTTFTTDESKWKAYKSITIKVTKVVLEVSVSRNKVPLGANFWMKGNTTASKVYIYASEGDTFQTEGGVVVKELPVGTVLEGADLNTVKVDVYNNTFKVKLTVKTDADTGPYTLYIFAPANESKIDRSTDAQATVSITVIPIEISKVLANGKDVTNMTEITLVKGGKIKIKIDTGLGDILDTKLRVHYVFSGLGLKAEGYEGASNGTFEFTIWSFINTSSGSFVDSGHWTEEKVKGLQYGDYTLKLTLELKKDSTYEEQCTWGPVTVHVIKPEYTIFINGVKVCENNTIVNTSTINVPYGQDLKVVIKSNRIEGYDKVYVIVKSPSDKVYQQVSFDSNGTAEVDFSTYSYQYGTELSVYIRDTLGTHYHSDPNKTIDHYFDILPTDPYARTYGGDDDVLISPIENGIATGFPVVITKAVQVTPTAVTTTTMPVATTTTPVATTTTTPVTNVTAVTTTTTTTTAVTTTTTPEKPTPGFEAIFAIAGLIAVAYLLRRR